MASIRSIDQIVNGINLDVEVISNFNNYLVVVNNNHNLKGILLPINDENKIRLENFISLSQRVENNKTGKKIDEESLICVPDSTLSHSAFDLNMNSSVGDDNEFCNECKRTLKKPYKRKSVNRELQRLTNHGLTDRILRKKNDISRRESIKLDALVKEGESTKKERKESKEVVPNKDNNVNPNISRPKSLEKFNAKRDEVVTIRTPKDRALKTKANEKIIDLCTRKSNKIVKETQPKSEVKKKPKIEMPNELFENSPIKMSDTSIYDFVDEDYESEPVKALYNENRKSYFMDKSNNSIKLDKRSYKRKLSPSKTGNNNDDEIHSNPGIMSYEYKGTKFSINNIVWAKIPGYPFWPAHITSFDNVSASKSQGKRCRINWIGWNQKSFLPLKSLLHFEENFKVKYSAKFKSQKYKTAIELACKELGLDFDDLIVDMGKKSPVSDRNNSSQNSMFGKRKSVDLDDIFPSKNSSKDIELDMAAKAYSDEDTDEEEKARSALITVESLEANNILSGMIMSKQS